MTFQDMNLGNALQNALNESGFTEPTTIQSRAFPVIMSGRDVLGIAQTGTGKTFAYLLPCLRLWKFSKERHPQVLIIVPTRELVVQVTEEVKKLSTYLNVVAVGVYGGTNLNTQAGEVDLGADIIVGTPGRLMDLVYHGTLKLKSIKRLVIDEVDEMLDQGFRHQLHTILEMLPAKRQNLMFSATLTEDIQVIIDEYFKQPERIEAAPVGSPIDQIEQSAFLLPNFNTKISFVQILLKNPELNKVLMFVSTKAMADLVEDRLMTNFESEMSVIHSNKSQNARFKAVEDFKSGEIRILLATDIIARGLDVAGVSHVINFDIPDDPLNYIHRIGRTGRAGQTGNAIALVADYEKSDFEAIEGLMDMKVNISSNPENLEISEELIDAELPEIRMKNILAKIPVIPTSGSAFHEKKAKNKKVNAKIRYSDKMHAKYGKPKSRGQKSKKKK
ncbi:MAG: DEAD/DEAH box helicase [Saprospiraceae bacterium]|nr:DEAD/DEAH box helicase [Saprospiraceae bacterium]